MKPRHNIYRLIALFFVVASAGQLYAQNTNPNDDITLLGSVGVFGAFGIHSHSVDFRGLPGVPSCCPQYSSGSGNGFSLGALYEFPVNSFLDVEIRGLFSTVGGTLSANERKFVFDGKKSVVGLFEHTIATDFSTIAIAPSVKYAVFNALKVSVGISAGLLKGATYSQQERLITPDDILFENDSRTRLASSGNITETRSFHIGATAGISYELPLNSNATMIAAPEISYTFGLTDVLEKETWKVHTLRLGVALKYAWYQYPELAPPTIDMPPPPEVDFTLNTTVGNSLITGSVRGQFVDESGNPAQGQVLDIKNITSTNVAALVNYVFFDDSSAVIPQRYSQLSILEAENFRLRDLESSGTLGIYYNILNIVGKRMQLYPDATITLTGCTSGGDSEKDKPNLSKDRVDAVRSYLMDFWKIDSKRIGVKYRDIPEIASNIKNEDGLAENRRVEITSKSWEILDVLSFNDTVRQLSSPIIALNAQAKAGAGVAKWQITASQSRKVLKEYKGNSEIPSEPFKWNLAKEPNTIPKLGEPISLSIDITDKEGKSELFMGTPITIKQYYDQKERIETFSLIIFGFNVSSVNETNQRILNMIKARITPNSIVTVTGFTDRTGAADYNQKLSDRRAKEIGKILKVPEGKSGGKGGSELLYDNNLPEGRFYCRTVRVTIETPIQ